MAGTALEKHPGTDCLPYRLGPGGEGGRGWQCVPGVGLLHDGAEGGAEVDRGPVALTTHHLAGVVTVRRGHQVDVTEQSKIFSLNLF